MTSASVGVVWLIDMDPPSDIGGGRGFYPALDRTDPPDEELMRARFGAALEAIRGDAGGRAVVTVHTSPRFREIFLREPYLDIWQRFIEAGVSLALHPHEERADGSTLYDDAVHLRHVIASTMELARSGGIRFDAFRSGTFSFNPALPGMLADAGITVDLSAAPALRDPRRGIDWPATSARSDVFHREGIPVVEVPIGWDGIGCDLDASYLFNERMDLDRLIRVWDMIRARAEASSEPLLVNFLCHGFGLADPCWRRQASNFLSHIQIHGGRLVGIDEAERRFGRTPAAPALAK